MDLNISMNLSIEESSQILILFWFWYGLFFLFRLLFLLWLLFLLGLLFLSCSYSLRSWCGSSESLVSVSNELMDRFSLDIGEKSFDLSIIRFACDATEDRFDIFSGYIIKYILISFLPERVRRA